MQKRNSHASAGVIILLLFLFPAPWSALFLSAQESGEPGTETAQGQEEEENAQNLEPELSPEEKKIREFQKQIEEKNQEIEHLTKEAERYREAVAQEQAKGSGFQAEIVRINRDISRLRNEVLLTERKKQKLELEIEITSAEIEKREESIQELKKNLASLLQAFAERSGESFLVVFIKHNVLSDFFQEIDSYAALQEKILRSLEALYALRDELSVKKAQAEGQKEKLEDLKQGLEGRKKVQEGVRKGKADLLQITKNNETRYQDLLRDREAKRRALELEVLEIETQIKVIIDPASLPERRSGFLAAPLPEMSLSSCWKPGEIKEENCVTQYFGDTPFARSGHYNGNGHNGLDFRGDVGTPVFAAKEGVVEEAGDTDRGCRGASYGKWILIRHPGNISTLYAHLSAIGVEKGNTVSRGERIGFSGNTGYATGPHLHFTVLATQAAQIKTIRSRVCGTLMTLPVAALNGYLNPLDYL